MAMAAEPGCCRLPQVMMVNCAGGYRKIDDADHPLKEVGEAAPGAWL
jgi:hypothetical protein